VHVLCGVVFAGCVIPPPLTIEQDGGVNAPPAITSVLDTSGTARRPPDTMTLEIAPTTTPELTVTIEEIDKSDDLTVQLFVDYNTVDPKPAAVHCGAPADPSPIRVAHCTTSQLCPIGSDTMGHTLEIEAYDRAPDPNAPYRNTAGFFSTWTFKLECVPPS
jgi:hypothetical protein